MQGKDENPMRVVVDSKARTPENADFLVKGEGKRLIVVAEMHLRSELRGYVGRRKCLSAALSG